MQVPRLLTGSAGHAGGIWTGGAANCKAAPGDYDGDGDLDLSLKCGPVWNFYRDDGTYLKGIWTGGSDSDVPVPADYDGDGDDDPAAFNGGAWLFYDYATGAAHGIWTGATGNCLPAPADYDGDGNADLSLKCGPVWHFYPERYGTVADSYAYADAQTRGKVTGGQSRFTLRMQLPCRRPSGPLWWSLPTMTNIARRLAIRWAAISALAHAVVVFLASVVHNLLWGKGYDSPAGTFLRVIDFPVYWGIEASMRQVTNLPRGWPFGLKWTMVMLQAPFHVVIGGIFYALLAAVVALVIHRRRQLPAKA